MTNEFIIENKALKEELKVQHELGILKLKNTVRVVDGIHQPVYVNKDGVLGVRDFELVDIGRMAVYINFDDGSRTLLTVY